MGFPEQLKMARLSLNYTQQQVADLMGITKSTYCGYETGKRQPDVEKIKLLANILQTSGDTLLETGFSPESDDKIEEKYGYHAGWILNGEEPKLKQVSKNKALSEFHQRALAQLEKMNDEQVKAVLAFINSLDDIEKSFSSEKPQNPS